MRFRRILRTGWAVGGVLLLATTAALEAYAQEGGSIVGVVTMAGEGVPGVRIVAPSLGLETLTDMDGAFRLDALPFGPVEISVQAIAFGCGSLSGTVDVPSGGAASLRLKLAGTAIASGAHPMSVAVAPAGGADDTPYLVERLDADDLRHNPSRHIADLIRGAFPGARVVQGSGLPGSTVSIQLRGTTSLSVDRAPLVVVDGAITGGGLDDLDPLDVESIAVLKGSAASAMYGARGGAGVIEITTKRGVPEGGAPCSIQVESSS